MERKQNQQRQNRYSTTTTWRTFPLEGTSKVNQTNRYWTLFVHRNNLCFSNGSAHFDQIITILMYYMSRGIYKKHRGKQRACCYQALSIENKSNKKNWIPRGYNRLVYLPTDSPYKENHFLVHKHTVASCYSLLINKVVKQESRLDHSTAHLTHTIFEKHTHVEKIAT